MFLVVEIGMLIGGIVNFIRGKISVSETRAVYDTRARVLSLLLMAPFPISFCMGLVVGFFLVLTGRHTRDLSGYWLLLVMIEGFIIMACLFAYYAIGRAIAEPVRKTTNTADESLCIQPRNDFDSYHH